MLRRRPLSVAITEGLRTSCAAARRPLVVAGLLGAVLVAHAQPFPDPFELSGLNGANGFRLNGIAGSNFSGFAVSGLGDVNGDGIDDLLIGVYSADPNGKDSGQSYVVFGSSTGFPEPFELSGLNGSNGFRLNGIAESDFLGRAVSGLGDVNGDGIDDLLIGASGAEPNGGLSGQSYVVFGSSTGFPEPFELSTLNGANGFRLNGIAGGDRSGSAVSGLGDVNGDGIDDLLIGAYTADPNGSDSGQSYVVFGSSTGFPDPFELSSLNGANGFRLNGIAVYDLSGVAVSGLGDINGDGVDDFMIGAPGGDGGNGQAYLVFGSGSKGFADPFELSALDGSNGFRMNGLVGGDYTGAAVSGLGDVNGDGIEDLLIGAPSADPNGNYSGRSYVVFGSSTGFVDPDPDLFLVLLNGANGFWLNGIAEGDRSGGAVSGLGDVNGDGIDDLLIGASRADPNNSSSGQSYVVFGSSTGFPDRFELSALNGANGFRLNGIVGNDFSGSAVSGLGDVNGDGIDDLLIGAPFSDPNGVSSGQSYVVFGKGFPVNAGMSGSWFDPDRSGEGWLLEILATESTKADGEKVPGTAVGYWFTYPPASEAQGLFAEQTWIVGVGSIVGPTISFEDAVITSGAVFGPGFDPDAVVRSTWGDFSFTFSDCNAGTMSYNSGKGGGFGSGTLAMERITSVAGLECEDLRKTLTASKVTELDGSFSGSWFDPAHDGEGWLIEILPGGIAVVYWFSYDGDGNQAWFVGAGSIEGKTITIDDVRIGRGAFFGDDFDPDDVSLDPWGTMSFTFDSCNTGTMSYVSSKGAEFGSGSLNLERITQLAGLDCD